MIKASNVTSMVIGLIIGVVATMFINGQSYSGASAVLAESGHVEYQERVLIYTPKNDFLLPTELEALKTLSSQYDTICIKNGIIQ